MSEKIKLSIPQPCHEDWNKMTPAAQGKFCNSCSKEVIDFTNMSDQQLVAFFKKPGGVCGRFREEQLDHEMSIPRKRIPWAKYLFQVSLPALLFSFRAAAQTSKPKLTGDTICVPVKHPLMLGKPVAITHYPPINGIIKDESNNPVPFVTVLVKGTQKGITCNAEGKFQLDISRQLPVTLVVSGVGFVEREVVISSETPVVKMERSVMGSLAGEVVVVSNKSRKKNRL
jgi:hypothetical protein